MCKTNDEASYGKTDERAKWRKYPRILEAMAIRQPRYSKEEFAKRGDEIYERNIRPKVEEENKGKFVAIDIETGAYEMDEDEMVASGRLLSRYPDAQIWLARVGYHYVRRFRLRCIEAMSIRPLRSLVNS